MLAALLFFLSTVNGFVLTHDLLDHAKDEIVREDDEAVDDTKDPAAAFQTAPNDVQQIQTNDPPWSQTAPNDRRYHGALRPSLGAVTTSFGTTVDPSLNDVQQVQVDGAFVEISAPGTRMQERTGVPAQHNPEPRPPRKPKAQFGSGSSTETGSTDPLSESSGSTPKNPSLVQGSPRATDKQRKLRAAEMTTAGFEFEALE